MIYEDIFIGFMYLLSVFMLMHSDIQMKNSVNCGSFSPFPSPPFFPLHGHLPQKQSDW